MKVLVLDFLSFCFSQLSVEIIHVADYHKTFAKTTFNYGIGKFQCSLFEKKVLEFSASCWFGFLL